MSEPSEEEGKCKVHRSRSVTSFCKCHNVGLCFNCLQEMHKECFNGNQVESIEDAIENARVKSDDTMRRLQILDSRVIGKKRHNDASLRKLNAAENQLVQGIQKMTKDVINRVNALSKDALEVENSVIGARRTMLENESDTLTNIEHRIEAIRQTIDKCSLQNMDMEKYISELLSLENELDKLEDIYRESKFVSSDVKIHFFVSPMLSYIRDNFNALGELSVEDVTERVRSVYSTIDSVRRVSVISLLEDNTDVHEPENESLFIYDVDTEDGYADTHYTSIDHQIFTGIPVQCIPPPPPHRNDNGQNRYTVIDTPATDKDSICESVPKKVESQGEQILDAIASTAIDNATTDEYRMKVNENFTKAPKDLHERMYEDKKEEYKVNVIPNMYATMPKLPKKRSNILGKSTPLTVDQQVQNPTTVLTGSGIKSTPERTKPQLKPKPKPRIREHDYTPEYSVTDFDDKLSSQDLTPDKATLQAVETIKELKVDNVPTEMFESSKISTNPDINLLYRPNEASEDSISGNNSSRGSTCASGIIVDSEGMHPSHLDDKKFSLSKQTQSHPLKYFRKKELKTLQHRHSDRVIIRKTSDARGILKTKTISTISDVQGLSEGDVTNIRAVRGMGRLSNSGVPADVLPKCRKSYIETKTDDPNGVELSRPVTFHGEMSIPSLDGKRVPLITGMVILPESGHFVTCDYRNDILYLFDKNFCLLHSYVIANPYGCCLISGSRFAITSVNRQSVCVFDVVDSGLKCQKEEKVNVDMFGISYSSGFFCVSCKDHICVFNDKLELYISVYPGDQHSKGTLSRKWKKHKPFLGEVHYTAIHWSVDNIYIYVSDFEKNRVVCFNMKGAIRWSRDVSNPRGLVINVDDMIVAAKGGIFVLCAQTGKQLRHLTIGVPSCPWVLCLDSYSRHVYMSIGSLEETEARRINYISI